MQQQAVLACINALRLLAAALAAAALAVPVASAAAVLAGSVQSTSQALDLRRYAALSWLNLRRFRGAETVLLA